MTERSRVHASIHASGDDPFRAFPLADTPGHAVIFIDLSARVFLTSPAQADSLIRAAVAAKDLLIAAQVPA